MYKHFLIKKENGGIASVSDDKLIFDNNIFESKKIKMSDEDMDNFLMGDIPFLEKGKLKFKPHPDKAKKIEAENFKNELAKAKTVDELKILINNLLK